MKYVIVLGDGMADEPIEALDGKTPLEYADTPNLDRLGKVAEIGMVHTIPEGMKPGSDTANLSVLGYNPKVYYSGRSPLEALSIGVPMKDTDIALRCNIVTLSENDCPFEEQTIIDHSSSEISTKDCAVLLHEVEKELAGEEFQFYVGTSYRHCLIWNQGRVLEFTQPHDVLGQVIGQYLPAEEKFRSMMEKSYEILKNHPINIERKKQGLNPANCCWFWGAGTRPALSSFAVPGIVLFILKHSSAALFISFSRASSGILKSILVSSIFLLLKYVLINLILKLLQNLKLSVHLPQSTRASDDIFHIVPLKEPCL